VLRTVAIPAVALLLAGGVYVWAPARLAVVYAVGRASVCPYDRVAGAPREIENQIAAKDRFSRSKKLETDEKGFERWSTPKGEYWIPGQPFRAAVHPPSRNAISVGTAVRVKTGAVVLIAAPTLGVYATSPTAVEGDCDRAGAGEHRRLRRNFSKETGEGVW
jgi:hypothetical protein